MHIQERTIGRVNVKPLPTPVDVGVQQDSSVCRQFGQMDHFCLLLETFTFIHPHIWESDTHRHTLLTIKRLFLISPSTPPCSGWCRGPPSPADVMMDREQEHLHVLRGPVQQHLHLPRILFSSGYYLNTQKPRLK